MSLSYQAIISTVRPIMRMIDRPIGLVVEVVNGNESIRRKHADNGVLISTRVLPGSVEEVYLTRSGEFQLARSSSTRNGHVITHTRNLVPLTETEVEKHFTPEELRHAIEQIIDDRMINTLEKAKLLATKQEVLSNLKKEHNIVCG